MSEMAQWVKALLPSLMARVQSPGYPHRREVYVESFPLISAACCGARTCTDTIFAKGLEDDGSVPCKHEDLSSDCCHLLDKVALHL